MAENGWETSAPVHVTTFSIFSNRKREQKWERKRNSQLNTNENATVTGNLSRSGQWLAAQASIPARQHHSHSLHPHMAHDDIATQAHESLIHQQFITKHSPQEN